MTTKIKEVEGKQKFNLSRQEPLSQGLSWLIFVLNEGVTFASFRRFWEIMLSKKLQLKTDLNDMVDEAEAITPESLMLLSLQIFDPEAQQTHNIIVTTTGKEFLDHKQGKRNR